MACEDFQDDLSAWLDNELTPVEHARLAAHLQTCSECSRLLHGFRATSLRVRDLTALRAPISVTDAAMCAVRAMPRQHAEPWMERAWRLLCEPFFRKAGFATVGFAAAVIVAVIVGRHEWIKNADHTTLTAASDASRSSSHSGSAEGRPSPTAPSAGEPASDPYRLASVPPDAAAAEYDFRDPKTHGRRDASSFDEKERSAWQGGVWRHERRFGRDGWWWVVGRVWYEYDQSTEGPPSYVSAVRFVNPPSLSNPDPEQSPASK